MGDEQKAPREVYSFRLLIISAQARATPESAELLPGMVAQPRFWTNELRSRELTLFAAQKPESGSNRTFTKTAACVAERTGALVSPQINLGAGPGERATRAGRGGQSKNPTVWPKTR